MPDTALRVNFCETCCKAMKSAKAAGGKKRKFGPKKGSAKGKRRGDR
jgi:hypothetical protein